MSEPNPIPLGTRIFGALLIAAGFGTFAITALSIQDSEASDAEALAQAAFVTGRCTVVSATVDQQWITEERQPTIVTVRLIVHAPAGDVPNVRYRYPDYWWNRVSAAAARTSTLAPGADVECFYDAAQPRHAVLVRRTPPPGPDDPIHAADGQSPWIPASILGGSFLLFGVLAFVIKPDPKGRRPDD